MNTVVKEYKQQESIDSDLRNIAIASAEHELIQRYGTAGSQFLIGLRGINYETGQLFDRSLLKISQGNLNPDYVNQNVKQQAGFSAEVASVSKRNAQAIINKESSRFSRSEDIAGYGKNHNVVDIVELLDDSEITSQMKFIKDPKELLKNIACGEGEKKDFSRYLSVDKLEVPTEQVEDMKAICKEEAKKLAKQSDALRKLGKTELADIKLKQSKNYGSLEGKVTDSGLTTEEAIQYRLNPKAMTAKDIGKVSHEAGLEGLKFGVAIGGSISAVNNVVAVYSGNKEFSEAVLAISKDTLISGATGYATAASGTAIKTYMAQSSKEIVRNISKSNMPAMVVTACLSTGKSIKKYAIGELTEAELSQEIGLSVTGMMSSSMFAAIGQVAIPIPVLGALIGGMVGYALTNTMYQSFFDVLKDAKLSTERRQLVEMQCEAAKLLSKEYELRIKDLFAYRIQELELYSNNMFDALNSPDIDPNEFCSKMNRFAEELGTKLSINNIAELEAAMISDEPLVI
ncbi:hypothetical protein [Psychrobacter fozii]|uniref:Uncharacterized protein n=1 Tax=Psychrobacter fozii TaxID=198480 RepID=A0A2V4UEF7_9GAMM|nr:hypothetical protein [Psychrobacter fozii]PYE38517.1 hypothetical protein DFP82_107140 [Psychrobacter fozii]